MLNLIRKLFFSFAQTFILEKFKNKCKNPHETQTNLLNHILRKNEQTKFGRNHHFAAIKTLKEYQKAVPISDYDDLSIYIEASLNGEKKQLTKESPILYDITSGTTGAKKFIPITPEAKKSNSNIMHIWSLKLIQDHPNILKGRFFIFVSPEVEALSPTGIPCGSQSGSRYNKTATIIKSMFSIPYEVYKINNFDIKYYFLLRIAACQNISLIYACNPSSVLLFAKHLEKHSKRIITDIREGKFSFEDQVPESVLSSVRPFMKPNPKQAALLEDAANKGNGVLLPKYIWPDFQVIACWKGGTVGSYIKKFDNYFAKNVIVRELGYLASESFGSIPLSDNGSEGVLSLQSNFYEFYPVEEKNPPKGEDLIGVNQLEIGKEYYVYITTTSGLYRYNMNDIISVTGYYQNTPLISFIQKRKGIVSLVGEKLSEVQMLKSVDSALGTRKEKCEFIASIGISNEEIPYYVILIEFDTAPDSYLAQEIINEIDDLLKINNTEYASKRESLRLNPPILRCIKSGEFDKYRKREIENGNSDETFKILRLTEDVNFMKEFEYNLEVSKELLQEPMATN